MEQVVKEFDEILELTDTLHAPGGCPWDREQDFKTLQAYVIEEAHEVVEAVDSDDDQQIISELGDLLYTVVFYAKVADKEGRFKMQDVLTAIKEKLIRRHPHVFEGGDVSIAEVMEKWEQIKKKEKGHGKRESVLDGIPKKLHALARAQKVLEKIKRENSALLAPHTEREPPLSEQVIGEELVQAILDASEAGIDIEGALRRAINRYEEEFRASEKQQEK